MSRPDELTPVQRQAAVERIGENIALCSGAGCGKTLVLARRFAELLLESPDLENPLADLVALTFTDKAALEMSQRVRRTLGEFAAGAEEPLRGKVLDWLQAMPEARISTIHGFCAAVLRAHAVEAGLDPSFAICDASDLAVATMQAEAAEAAVLEAVEGGDAAAAELIGRGRLRDIIGQVEQLAGLRTECDLQDYLDPNRTLEGWRTRVAAWQKVRWNEFRRREDLADAMSQLTAASCIKPADLMAQARASILSLVDAALQSDSPPAEKIFGQVAGITLKGGSAAAWGGKDALAAVKSDIKTLREAFSEEAACFGEMGEADGQAATDLAVLARLALDARKRYAARKRQRGLLDFTDLLEHTGRLIADGAIAAGLRGQIRQLLLDEAQDTDAFQIRMLERLLFGRGEGVPPLRVAGILPASPAAVPAAKTTSRAAGQEPRRAEGAVPPNRTAADSAAVAPSAELPAGRLFLVGDPKQSIYRFRGARIEVFSDLCRRLGERNQLYLDVSFRSHKPLVAFVNHLFGAMMGSDYARIEAHRKEEPEQPAVEFLLAQAPAEGDDKPDSETLNRAQAAVTAQRIAEMVAGGQKLVWDKDAKRWRPVRYGDIAILFSRMTASLLYERELALRDVPYYVVAGSGFFNQQEVFDVLNALAAIDNPFDDVALLGALRGSLFGLDDNVLMHVAQACEPPYFEKLASPEVAARLDEPQRRTLGFARELLADLHRRKDAMPIDRIIERLLEETGYEAVLLAQFQGRRLAGNVRRLVELSRPGAGGTLSLAEFVAQMGQQVMDQSRYEQAAVAGEAENVVRLMTIHKAKGLEFPVVVLPDLSAARQPVGGAFLHRPDLGLTHKPAPPAGVEEEDEAERPVSYRLAARLEGEDLRKEDVRRLYVGATRACDHLVFVGADRRTEKGAVSGAGSYLAMLDRELRLLECADGDGRLTYQDDGRSYVALVRTVLPQPPKTRRAFSPGRKFLEQAGSPQDLAEAILHHGAVDLPVHRAGATAALFAAVHQDAAGQEPRRADAGATPELLGPLPADIGAAELAVTSLGEFEHCPMLYRWRYELLVPTRHRAAECRGRPARESRGHPGLAVAAISLDAATLGTLLHRCMELLDFAAPQSAGALIRRSAEELEIPPEVSRAALENEFRPMLETFLSGPLGREIAAAPRRLAELNFVLNQPPVRLAGQIDLLYQDAQDTWHIVDYKSDRVAPADVPAHAARYEFQMLTYAAAAGRFLGGMSVPAMSSADVLHEEDTEGSRAETALGRMGETPMPLIADATLYFLRTGTAHVIPMTPQALREAQARMVRLGTELITSRRTGHFRPCRGPHCDSCAYHEYCRAAHGE